MKVKMRKACGVAGKAVKADQIVECSDKDAKYLINTGAAEEYTAPKKPAPKKAASKAK